MDSMTWWHPARRKKHAGMLAAVFLLHAVCARAESGPALLSESTYLEDIPTVLTVSRLSQRVNDAPAAVTVIDSDTIRASGAADLTDLFRLVPGMYVGYNAGFMHTVNPVVSYHGMSDAYARNMQVLVDGRSVYSPLYGGVSWSDLPLTIEDIDRIEVTRGPNSASHGANSFLGIINIVTRHTVETVGNNLSALGGNGRHDLTLRHGEKLKDLSYRVTLGYRNDHGLSGREDDKRTTLFTLRADYQLSDRDQIELQFGYNGGDRQEGDLRMDNLLYLPRTKQIDNHFQALRWRHAFSTDSDLTLHGYHSYEKSEDNVVSRSAIPLVALPHILIDNDVRTERYDIEVQHAFSPQKSMRMVWGGSLRLDQTWAPMYLGTDKTQNFHMQRLFGHLEWRPLDRLVLNAGAMTEHNDLTGTDVTPRFSANFTLAPGHTLRAGISSATRTPTYMEEKFDWKILAPATVPGITLAVQRFLDTGGLAPEHITSREIGYLGAFGPLSIDSRIFYDHIDDVIRKYTIRPLAPLLPPGTVPYPGSNSTMSFINAGDATVRGFEAQAQWRMGSRTRVIANYSHVRINGVDVGKNFETSMPINSGSMLVSHRFDNHWNGSLAYYYTGVTCTMGDGECVKKARHWDLRLARNFAIGQFRGEAALNVRNLFDNPYQEFAEYNTMQRRAYFNLKLDF